MTVRTAAASEILGRARSSDTQCVGEEISRCPSRRDTREGTRVKSLEHAQVGDSRDVFDGFEPPPDLCGTVADLAHDARRQTWPLRRESVEDLRDARDVSGQVSGQRPALHRALCPTFASDERTAGVLRRGARTSAEVDPGGLTCPDDYPRTAPGGATMAYSKDSKSTAVRAKLDHPVIDGDGHWLEPIPIFLDYLREVGGPSIVDKFVTKTKDTSWYEMAPADRMDRRPHRPTWWGEPANSLDRATAMVPRLFYERLDDFGIDFALVYTSLGLFYVSNPDEELRRSVARAVNRMNAEMFRPFKDRMTPAAVVPVHTPQEAIEEATYAVRELGLKVIMIANHVRRPVPASARLVTDPLTHGRMFIDSLGFESAYDYDPFWRTCLDLRVAVTAHSGSMGWHGRESVDSFTFNHIGHFANASHA